METNCELLLLLLLSCNKIEGRECVSVIVGCSSGNYVYFGSTILVKSQFLYHSDTPFFSSISFKVFESFYAPKLELCFTHRSYPTLVLLYLLCFSIFYFLEYFIFSFWFSIPSLKKLNWVLEITKWKRVHFSYRQMMM